MDIVISLSAEAQDAVGLLVSAINKLEAALESAPNEKPAARKVSADAETDAKPAKKAAKKVAEQEEQFDLGDDEDEAEEPTLTIKEVIKACKANRETAKKVLKRLKLDSVHELKPGQYPRFMEEIGA